MAKRRANGEGSLRKRKDGRWEGRYTAGTDPVTGKAIVKNVLGKTQAEVREKLKKAIAESENLDIKRSDVDTNNLTISISKQAYRTKGALTVQPPKTNNSMRKIALSAETMELLKQEHNKHPGNPYLFPSPVTGGMYHPDSVVKLHQKILKDAGLEHIRFHDLRHTFAILALQNGIDVKTVSSMLGHSSAGFTLATYTHATNKVQEQAAAKMGNLLKQAL